MEGEKNRSNKIMKGTMISFCTLLIIYFIFFINTISVSAKTVNEKEITPEVYTLTLQEKGGVKELINGVDIGLKYSSETSKVITYDDGLLKACISKLSCLDSSKILKSQNANFIYEDNGYVISREVYGNEINKAILYEHVVKAIQDGDTELNLESINCYEVPKFVTSSSEVAYAKETLNKYVSAKITYTFAGLTQYLDGSVIKNWIGVDGNFQVTINESKVRSYVDNLANIYNESLGTSIKVSGGYDGNNHSWIIDSSEETKALIENIKNGQTITKNPIYAQTAAASYFSNVGDTYVEIDMAKQHLWYYKDGYLVVEGDVVTGNVSSGCSTPTGVYHLRSKEKDSVLRGPGYECPVSFWMPFVNQIGLHDASWRSEFGGEIYKTDGSHGCVNAPYYVAKTVYDNINSGDTIICHD
jgi:lipoprotein-anchoring transpeptidase ErfK/SrfK